MLLLFLVDIELVVWDGDFLLFQGGDDGFKGAATNEAFLLRRSDNFNLVDEGGVSEVGEAKHFNVFNVFVFFNGAGNFL